MVMRCRPPAAIGVMHERIGVAIEGGCCKRRNKPRPKTRISCRSFRVVHCGAEADPQKQWRVVVDSDSMIHSVYSSVCRPSVTLISLAQWTSPPPGTRRTFEKSILCSRSSPAVSLRRLDTPIPEGVRSQSESATAIVMIPRVRMPVESKWMQRAIHSR